MSWVLILTLFMADGSYKSAHAAASISSVAGFKSRESCLTAANLWLSQTRNYEFTARAMCVQQ